MSQGSTSIFNQVSIDPAGSGGGGGGGITIGTIVNGGTPDEVLYIDNAGNLYSDPNFTRDSTTNDTRIKKASGVLDYVVDVGDNIGVGFDHSGIFFTDTSGFGSAAVAVTDAGNIGGTPGDGGFVLDSTSAGTVVASLFGTSDRVFVTVNDVTGENAVLGASSGTGTQMSYTDGVGPTYYHLAGPTGLTFGEGGGFSFILPTATAPLAGQVLGSIAGGSGQLDWISVSGSIAIGGIVAGGTPHEVLYVNAAGNLDSDAAFTRNMTTNVTTLANTAGGITVSTFWNPATVVGTTWNDGISTAGTTVDQRGLQIRAYDNQVTLENFIIKQASGLKLAEMKNSGYFFVNNSTVEQSLIQFTGVGLNDLSQVPLTGFDALVQSTTYTITIDGNGVPDTFTWTDGTTTVNNVPITLLPNILSHNLEIQFAALTGHTIGDSWTWNVDYVVGRTIAANPNITDVNVKIGDIDGLFNQTFLEVEDATETIWAETNNQQQLLHVSGSDDNVILGYLAGATAFSTSGTFIGDHAGFGDTGGGNVAVGAHSLILSGFPPYNAASGNRNTAIGTLAGLNNNGSDNVYLGYESRMVGGGPFNHSVAIGRESYITATAQMAFGSGLVSYEVNEFVFGGQERNGGGTNSITMRSSDGEVASNALGTTINFRSGNGGGTDRPGGAMNIRGGRSTGTGAGGDISFYSTPASLVSGATLNTEVRMGKIEDDYTVVFGDVDNALNGWAFGSNTAIRQFLAGDIGSTNNGMAIFANDIAQTAGFGDVGGVVNRTSFSIDDSIQTAQGVGKFYGEIYPENFIGVGLNDANYSGTLTAIATNAYIVEIDSVGATDTFKWNVNGGAFTTGVAITGAAQLLSAGISITFGAVTGHTIGDRWTITYTNDVGPGLLLDFLNGGYGLGDVQSVWFKTKLIVDDPDRSIFGLAEVQGTSARLFYVNANANNGSLKSQFGWGALVNETSGGNNVAFGPNAGSQISDGNGNTIHGYSALGGTIRTGTTRNTAVGEFALYNLGSNNQQYNSAFGAYASVGNAVSGSLALGAYAIPTSSNQAVIGGDNGIDGTGKITDYVLYRGPVSPDADVDNVVLRKTHASGTDQPTSQLFITSGNSTGSADGGQIVIAVAKGAASGTTTRDALSNGVLLVSEAEIYLNNRVWTDVAAVTAANDLVADEVVQSNTMVVSGNTTINGIDARHMSGQPIILYFSGTPTLKHNTAPSAGFRKMKLAGSVDANMVAGSTITFVGIADEFIETARTFP